MIETNQIEVKFYFNKIKAIDDYRRTPWTNKIK